MTLISACQRGNAAIVERLLRHRADANMADEVIRQNISKLNRRIYRYLLNE